jgi:DNA-binding NarL/FixJ family response regulator
MTHPQKKPTTVMLVDDHMTMLWGLQRLIEAEAPRMQLVGSARSCEEALEKIGQLMPDIVVLDLDLGGKSSLDIIPQLLASPKAQVLVLTAERNQVTLDLAVQKGARGIISKDVSPEHIIKAIEKMHQGELWIGREMLGRAFSQFQVPKVAPTVDPKVVKYATLTEREQKILHAVVRGSGASNKMLAETLFISEHTLRNHLSSIYQKLDVANRMELYVYAVRYEKAHPTVDASGHTKVLAGGNTGNASPSAPT